MDLDSFCTILVSAMVLVVTFDIPTRIPKTKINPIIDRHHIQVVHSIKHALEGFGHEVVTCIADSNLEANLRKIRPQIAFNLSTRTIDNSDCALAPLVLAQMKIPFTGSSARVCANAYNKLKVKRILERYGVKSPKALVIKKKEDIYIPPSLAFPLFVKPVKGGCSRGIRKENLITEKRSFTETLVGIFERMKEPLLVEEFMPGREFSVGVIGNQVIRILPIEEFINGNGASEIPFRNFARKMIDFKEECFVCPAELCLKDCGRIEEAAMKAYQCLKCQDYARIDIRLDQCGNPNILDVNVLPSLIPGESSFALMAKRAGIAFNNLVQMILELACQRYRITFHGESIEA